MADERRYHRRPKRRRRSLLGRVLTFVVICFVLFLGISVFFKLSEIEVAGETRYTQEQIINASGVEYGEHLFFIKGATIANNIRQKLPYVDEVTITRRFPGTLKITVNDSQAIAAVQTESGYLLLNKRCKVLEIVDEASASGLISIEGISPILPAVGQTIALGEEDSAKVQQLQDLLSFLVEYELYSQVDEIDITLYHDLTLTYSNRFRVLLGSGDDLQYKLDMLVGVIAECEEYEMGTIDLTESGSARFIPE